MSHELRTPLNSIIGFSDVLEGIDSLNEKQRRYAQNIQKSGRLLLEMINDILDLERIESGTLALEVQPHDVDDLLAIDDGVVNPLAEGGSAVLPPDDVIPLEEDFAALVPEETAEPEPTIVPEVVEEATL